MLRQVTRTIERRIIGRMHPAQWVFFSYMLVIALGTLLLLLPAATVSGSIPLIDALFTATSAVCVTGLVVVDTGSTFTIFGQLVILALIQTGGLGIMTFSVALFRLIGRQISFRDRMIVQDIFTHTPREDLYLLLKSIFIFAFAAEIIGAGLLFIFWMEEYPAGQALYLAVFHSVSAFCNAGFALFENSLMDYRDSLLLTLTVGGLIILGSIGFPVVYDLYYRFIHRKKQRHKLLAQTKIVLVTTLLLVVGGTALFALLEHDNSFRGYSFGEVTLMSLFQVVSARTAGFNTVDIAALSAPTLAIMLFLMFVGASPGSVGGGVKTTTLAILCAFAYTRLRRRRHVNLFRKTIPPDILSKSLVLVLVSIALVALFFFLLLVTMGWGSPENQQGKFLPALFETVSAFATVGLSMGTTGQLDLPGKIWIIILMLIGRVGVLTLAYIIAGPLTNLGTEHAEENIMVG